MIEGTSPTVDAALRKKRILVTGGAGFLGSHLCDHLLRYEGQAPVEHGLGDEPPRLYQVDDGGEENDVADGGGEPQKSPE